MTPGSATCEAREFRASAQEAGQAKGHCSIAPGGGSLTNRIGSVANRRRKGKRYAPFVPAHPRRPGVTDLRGGRHTARQCFVQKVRYAGSELPIGKWLPDHDLITTEHDCLNALCARELLITTTISWSIAHNLSA